MKKKSAGILIYKFDKGKLKVFLVHPGGPYWKDKNERAWDIPKGEVNDGENELFETALRELFEETGIKLDKKKEDFIYLGDKENKSGKEIHIWAVEGDWDGLLICRSYVEIEWPYKSGKKIKIPEVDKAGFFDADKAKKMVYGFLEGFLDGLEEKLNN